MTELTVRRERTTVSQALETCERVYAAPLPEPALPRGDLEKLNHVYDGDDHDVAAIPVLPEIESYLLEVQKRLKAPAQAKVNRVLLGILAAAFPSGRAGEGYLEALLYDVTAAGFSPYVVAQACQKLRRTGKFVPAISEVLAACQEARQIFALAEHRAAYAVEVVRGAKARRARALL